jgi:hypothetical protein
MAHFAQLDENNVVVQVIVINNSELVDEYGNESEANGVSFCQSLYGENTRWVQTSYNNKFRCRYAVIEGTYDETRGVFLHRKLYPSWVLNEVTFEWDPPIPYPDDGKRYNWDESTVSWVEVFPIKFNL